MITLWANRRHRGDRRDSASVVCCPPLARRASSRALDELILCQTFFMDPALCALKHRHTKLSTVENTNGFDAIFARIFSLVIAPKKKSQKSRRNYGSDFRKSPLPFPAIKLCVFSYPTFCPTADPAPDYLIGR